MEAAMNPWWGLLPKNAHGAIPLKWHQAMYSRLYLALVPCGTEKAAWAAAEVHSPPLCPGPELRYCPVRQHTPWGHSASLSTCTENGADQSPGSKK